MGRFSSRSLTVRWEDAGGIGLLAGPGPGDFTHGETNSENAERIRILNRTRFDCHVVGDDLEQEWSITISQRNESQTSALLARILDFQQRTGTFDPDTGTTPTVTLSLNPDVWAYRVIVTMILGGTTATFTLPHNVSGYSFAEAKEGNSITVSGVNNGVIART